MKTAAAAIPFAGFQLSEARDVCAFFNGGDEEYLGCVHERAGSSGAIRRLTSLIRISVATIYKRDTECGTAKRGFPLSRIICHMGPLKIDHTSTISLSSNCV